MIAKFTHTIRMDWMLPGLEPTGKRVDVPLVAVVRFRDGKLAHEHYLLGSSLGSCAARPDRCRFPPGGRHRDRRPKSRGRIRLTGPNPMDAVQIETNMMSHPDDLKAAIACVQLCREIGNSAALRPFTKREVMPGNLKGAALENFIRDSVVTYWHQTCTAKMGRDSMSVVDANLKVYGIENLRIADGSIMPRVTTGNTMAPCVAPAKY
jgi:hypothetical protein